MLATASGVFAAVYAYFQEDADMGINEGSLCAGAALLLGASFLRKPLGCAIVPPSPENKSEIGGFGSCNGSSAGGRTGRRHDS